MYFKLQRLVNDFENEYMFGKKLKFVKVILDFYRVLHKPFSELYERVFGVVWGVFGLCEILIYPKQFLIFLILGHYTKSS